MRKVAKIGVGYRLVGLLAGLYLRLIRRTTRWRHVVPAETQAVLASGKGFVGAIFHSRLCMLMPCWSQLGARDKKSAHVLISSHRDGVMIACAIRSLGFSTVHGSGSKKSSGGLEALRDMYALVRADQVVVVTPDGPRGPNMRVKGGALQVAQATGVPLITATGAVSRRKLLGTWDRFCLALPFARGEIRWSKPFLVPQDAKGDELEALRRTIEEQMIEATRQCDAAFGLTTPEPGRDSGGRPSARKEKRKQLDAGA